MRSSDVAEKAKTEKEQETLFVKEKVHYEAEQSRSNPKIRFMVL